MSLKEEIAKAFAAYQQEEEERIENSLLRLIHNTQNYIIAAAKRGDHFHCVVRGDYVIRDAVICQRFNDHFINEGLEVTCSDYQVNIWF